jgi:hypothetical protein
MQNTLVVGLVLGTILVASHAALAGEPSTIFPGAVGFGVDSPAGRGGKIIRVVNLDSEGPGSLREALSAKGPRIIVFEVGGVIDLKENTLAISEPFVTVAGQTAPAPGITIIRAGIAISTHDVLLQHIRVRPGDAGKAKKSGWEPDGIATGGGKAYNIVIDHCSVTWAVDENLSASGTRTEGPDATSHRITFSNCIIAEGLNNSSHTKGSHSKGSLIHDFCTDIAIIGNLYAHNKQRNPYFKAHTTGVIVNNVVYNPGSAAIQLNFVPGEWRDAAVEPVNARVSIVGNLMIHGEDTHSTLPMIASRGDAYMEDNIALYKDGTAAEVCYRKINRLSEKPVWPEGLTPLPAEEVADHVARHAGAWPKERDAVDKRISSDFMQRKGRIIDSQDDVGGYPTPEPTARTLDVPEKGIDAWLAQMAAEIE